MISTALVISAAMVIVGACVLALKLRLRRRRDRATISPDEAVRAHAEALQQLARDREKENVSHAWQDALSAFGQ